ncbi:phosphatase PAP2 family protein [Streptomyces sp. ME03-5709C]|nr:phosphatase PAP2 family protein [Streptomyces sp. ME03-5709C]
MVGLERVYCGAHHPSDVTAGVAVGLAAARPATLHPHSSGKQEAGRGACCLSGFDTGRRAMSSGTEKSNGHR